MLGQLNRGEVSCYEECCLLVRSQGRCQLELSSGTTIAGGNLLYWLSSVVCCPRCFAEGLRPSLCHAREECSNWDDRRMSPSFMELYLGNGVQEVGPKVAPTNGLAPRKHPWWLSGLFKELLSDFDSLSCKPKVSYPKWCPSLKLPRSISDSFHCRTSGLEARSQHQWPRRRSRERANICCAPTGRYLFCEAQSSRLSVGG